MSCCVSCGAALAPEWIFCPRCGKRKRPEHCPLCGRILRAEWRFCPSCGTGTETESLTVPDVVPEEAATEPLPEAPLIELPAETVPELTADDGGAETIDDEELFIVECVPVADTVPGMSGSDDGETGHTLSQPMENTETVPMTEADNAPQEDTENADHPEDTDGSELYEQLVRERDALREELRSLNERANRLNRFDDDYLKLPQQERRRISEERRELRVRQGRCHARVMELSGQIRAVAEQETRKGRELYSLEHPELVCPTCSARVRKGVDTWPLCPCCGEDVTAPGKGAVCNALLKVRCGDEGVKRVWYTGSREFYDYWDAYRGYHKRHEYRYSGSRAVLTVERAATRGERIPSEMPEELLPYHVLLRIGASGETETGITRTENVGTLDMSDLSEAERLAFLRLLLAAPPEKERRRFRLE